MQDENTLSSVFMVVKARWRFRCPRKNPSKATVKRLTSNPYSPTRTRHCSQPVPKPTGTDQYAGSVYTRKILSLAPKKPSKHYWLWNINYKCVRYPLFFRAASGTNCYEVVSRTNLWFHSRYRGYPNRKSRIGRQESRSCRNTFLLASYDRDTGWCSYALSLLLLCTTEKLTDGNFQNATGSHTLCVGTVPIPSLQRNCILSSFPQIARLNTFLNLNLVTNHYDAI